MTYAVAVWTFRRTFVADALRAHGGNVTATAQTLGLHRTRLQRLIRQFGIDIQGIREETR